LTNSIASLALTQPQFPLNTELKSSLQAGGVNVSTRIKVSKAGDVYTYLFSIRNDTNKRVLVKWSAIDKALYYGHDLETIWEVPPNESIIIALEHTDPPVEVREILTVYLLTKNKDLVRMLQTPEDRLKKVKLNIPKVTFFRSVSGIATGALPSSYIRENMPRIDN
jgi:hypothetical protein